MIYTLLEPDHPLLTSPLPEFVDSEWEHGIKRKDILNNMVETMKHYGGIGLSANQVGFPYRMFVFGDASNYIPCFNPKVVVASENTTPMEEGCLTYPGLFVKIWRPDWVEVEFEDENSEPHNETFEGLMARVFLHELDHMDGIDFTSRASKLHLDMAKRKVKKAKRKLKRAHGKDFLKKAS